jgi:hypothetical protein
VATLALSPFPSAAALANVGTVLTHDLLILRLPVAVVGPVDEVKDDGERIADEVVVVVVVLPVGFVEDEMVVGRDVVGMEVDVGVEEVSDALQMFVEPW